MNFKALKEINDGITYNKGEDIFTFNFEHDGENDVIELCKDVYKSEIFGKTFYYGYKFSESADKIIRGKFIDTLKFHCDKLNKDNVHKFIRKSVGGLDNLVNLAKYEAIVYPQSISWLTKEIMWHIQKYSKAKILKTELIKSLPVNITFNYDAFIDYMANATMDNGKPRFNESAMMQTLSSIESMMNKIHNLDYFSLAKNVKQKYRPYIDNYYQFENADKREAYKRLNNTNVLVIDDITTSGSTMNLLLKTLRTINDNNYITIFSLLGNSNV